MARSAALAWALALAPSMVRRIAPQMSGAQVAPRPSRYWVAVRARRPRWSYPPPVVIDAARRRRRRPSPSRSRLTVGNRPARCSDDQGAGLAIGGLGGGEVLVGDLYPRLQIVEGRIAEHRPPVLAVRRVRRLGRRPAGRLLVRRRGVGARGGRSSARPCSRPGRRAPARQERDGSVDGRAVIGVDLRRAAGPAGGGERPHRACGGGNGRDRGRPPAWSAG